MQKVVETRDGHRLTLNVSGEGAPLIFLHGWGIGAGAFDQAHLRLADVARVITFNQRGHADASPAAAPTLEMLVDDLQDLMVSEGIEHATLVGWSMGSLIAWMAYARREVRARIASIVSIDMSPRVTNDASWQLGFADGRQPRETLRAMDVIVSDWASMAGLLRHRIYAEGFSPDPAAQEKLFRSVEQLDPKPLASLWESMTMQDLRRDLPKIDVPTLLVHGAKSQLYRLETGHYLKRVLPQAELKVFADAGHAPHLEEPDRFYGMLAAFHLSHGVENSLAAEDKSVSQFQGGTHA